jgi:hypothetical protein
MTAARQGPVLADHHRNLPQPKRVLLLLRERQTKVVLAVAVGLRKLLVSPLLVMMAAVLKSKLRALQNRAMMDVVEPLELLASPTRAKRVAVPLGDLQAAQARVKMGVVNLPIRKALLVRAKTVVVGMRKKPQKTSPRCPPKMMLT